MFKNFGLQVPKAGMDHAAFMAHWREVHAPLSNGVAGVRGYVLNEILQRCADPAGISPLAVTPAIDGIAQLWFDSREAMAAVTQTPEARRWFSDGINYLGARTGIGASERCVVALPGAAERPRYKLIRLLARAATQDAAAFAGAWHGALAAAVAALPGVRGYVQSTVSAINPATNMPPVAIAGADGVDEIWFDTPESARLAAARLPAPALAASCCWLAHETVIIAPPAG
jgi:uncharacterized protein (TIGR02118 family)